jgi:hypothetical protein
MKEKADLMEKGLLSKKSSLLSLNPFLDGINASGWVAD